jgi:class 3 adenylate cyclase
MHKNLRTLLHTARGQSQHVVVIFLDIRGFSSFAKIAESTDAAEFLASAYTKILDDYIPDAAFFKLTGDGMLVIYDYDRNSLTEVVRKATDLSIRLVEAFPTLTEGDAMLNFNRPEQLGIGLARGAATILTSDDTVLDYSGRPLNLAARLMDLARPSGVVLDASFGFELLDEKVQSRFKRESVYVKGIAEDDPIPVYYLADRTSIPDQNKFPMNRMLRFPESTESVLFSELCERGARFYQLLSNEPAKLDDIEVHVNYPKTKADGSKHPTMRWTPSYPATYQKKQNKHYAVVNYKKITQGMRTDDRTDNTWPVEVTIEYSIREAPKVAEPPVSDSESTGPK